MNSVPLISGIVLAFAHDYAMAPNLDNWEKLVAVAGSVREANVAMLQIHHVY